MYAYTHMCAAGDMAAARGSEFGSFQERLATLLAADFHAAAAAGPPDTNAEHLQSLSASLDQDEECKKAVDELQTLYQQKHVMQRMHHLRWVAVTPLLWMVPCAYTG